MVLCHSEGYRRGIASNHADVMHWWKKFGVDMDDFRARCCGGAEGEANGDLTEQEVRAIVREELAAPSVQLGDLLKALIMVAPPTASSSIRSDEPDDDDLDDDLDSFGC